MQRRVIPVAAATIVLLDTLLWLVGTNTLNAEAKRWMTRARSQGWTIAAGGHSYGGWPLAATVAIDKAAVSGGEHYIPGGLAWSADRVVLSVSLAHPLTLRVAAEGQQFLRLSHAPDVGFVAGSAIVRLPLLAGRHGRGGLEATAISGGIAGSRHPQDVQLGAVSIDLEEDQGADLGVAARLDVRVRGIGLPDIGRWPLGATIAVAGATVALTSPPLPGQPAGRPAETRAVAQAEAWRDGGGRLSLHEARLRWGPLAVSAEADLALDGRLQLAGHGRADVGGSAPALDAAAQAGMIPQGLALTAKAVLAVMAHVTEPDGSDAVRLPFLLHDSTVSVGQIPVARLPEIRW